MGDTLRRVLTSARFEFTLHLSFGQDEQPAEPAGDVFAVTERATPDRLGFIPNEV